MYKISVGVSSCLCGNKVRHDGSSKTNRFLLDTLGQYFDLKTYCPEMGAGLGVPRPTLRLKRFEQQVRLVESKNDDMDHTEALQNWADETIPRMRQHAGFVLKNGSPSCGMERVKLYDHNNVPKKEAVGLFAERLMASLPCLPVEEEGRLNDAILRENFILRVYVYSRWLQMQQEGITVARLMDFHKRHKFIVMAHDEANFRLLGPMVAQAKADNLDELAERYILQLMTSLKKRASRKRHSNVMMHIFGFLKRHLESDVKQEILAVLDKYRTGLVPLVVPLTLIRHYLKQYPDEYMDSQYYLEPYPDELMLRNDV